MTEIARADVVGSLLRPEYLRDARAQWREGKVSDNELKEITDKAIDEIIAMQERAGLDAITDGEFRRPNFIATMGVREGELGCTEGFETVVMEQQWLGLWKNRQGEYDPFVTGEEVPRSIVTGKVGPRYDIVGQEFPYLKDHTGKAIPKFTFPAPSWHRVGWEKDYSSDAYPTVRDFLLDIRDYTRGIVEQLIAAGCTYIHMDAPNYAQWHLDDSVRDAFAKWGRDLDAELIEDAEIDNSVFEGIGDDVTKAIHLCRGNAPDGRYLAVGGYEKIAERLFPRLGNYNCLLLEYDTPRAGDFTPLQHVNDGTAVVLGLITSKDATLEDKEEVKARIDDAAKYVPLENLAISPQCGFASGEFATTMTIPEQEAKLKLVGEIADEVWG